MTNEFLSDKRIDRRRNNESCEHLQLARAFISRCQDQAKVPRVPARFAWAARRVLRDGVPGLDQV